MSKKKDSSEKDTPKYDRLQKAVLQSSLTTSEKMVYWVLRSFAWKCNVSYPSIRTIATLASLSPRRAIDIVKSLEGKGAVKVFRTMNQNGKQPAKNQNVYLLLLDSSLLPDANNEADVEDALRNAQNHRNRPLKIIESGHPIALNPAGQNH